MRQWIAGVVVAAAMSVAGCAAGGGGAKPPSPESIAELVVGAATVSCQLFVPVDQREAARPILTQVAVAAESDPATAYEQISAAGELAPVVGLIWQALHLVLDQYAADTVQWVALAERSVGAAARGCLGALGPPADPSTASVPA